MHAKFKIYIIPLHGKLSRHTFECRNLVPSAGGKPESEDQIEIVVKVQCAGQFDLKFERFARMQINFDGFFPRIQQIRSSSFGHSALATVIRKNSFPPHNEQRRYFISCSLVWLLVSRNSDQARNSVSRCAFFQVFYFCIFSVVLLYHHHK